MKEVTLTVPWGQYDPIVKIQNKNTVYYNIFFLQIIFHNTVCTEISTDRHDFVLGYFEYIEVDRETHRK
jgi:hypothetical protein